MHAQFSSAYICVHNSKMHACFPNACNFLNACSFLKFMLMHAQFSNACIFVNNSKVHACFPIAVHAYACTNLKFMHVSQMHAYSCTVLKCMRILQMHAYACCMIFKCMHLRCQRIRDVSGETAQSQLATRYQQMSAAVDWYRWCKTTQNKEWSTMANSLRRDARIQPVPVLEDTRLTRDDDDTCCCDDKPDAFNPYNPTPARVR
jgi:hypothetical protein